MWVTINNKRINPKTPMFFDAQVEDRGSFLASYPMGLALLFRNTNRNPLMACNKMVAYSR
jgi:hypothetical protein